jgi:growth hormone-inducible transmembrane protein
MAFILRRPFAITAALRQSTKPTQSGAVRAFHHASPKPQKNSFFAPQTAPSLSKSQHIVRSTFRRNYQQAAYNPVAQGDLRQRLLYGAGIFGATILGINLIFNRETREDGGMPVYEREYLNDTFMHTGLGIGIIGIAARQLHASGWSYRLMAANPWVVLGVGLVGSIGTMYGCMATDPNK